MVRRRPRRSRLHAESPVPMGGSVAPGDVFGGRGFEENLRVVCEEGGGGVKLHLSVDILNPIYYFICIEMYNQIFLGE